MPRGPANGNGDRVQNPGNGNSNGANPQALKNRIDRLRYKLRKVQASQVCGVLLKAVVWALGGTGMPPDKQEMGGRVNLSKRIGGFSASAGNCAFFPTFPGVYFELQRVDLFIG